MQAWYVTPLNEIYCYISWHYMKRATVRNEIMWMFSEAMISIIKELSVLLLLSYLHVFISLCDSVHETTDTEHVHILWKYCLVWEAETCCCLWHYQNWKKMENRNVNVEVVPVKLLEIHFIPEHTDSPSPPHSNEHTSTELQ